MKTSAFHRRKKGKRAVNPAVIAVTVLMLLSFMGGMLTQRALTKTPQQDANLSYIDGIPVYTDFIPEGRRPFCFTVG